MAGFEDLEVWKRAVELSAEIYLRTMELRDFGFRDQITRAGLSIPSNIAEGMERCTPADQCKFLDYARASCGEVRTQTIVGMRVGFIPAEIGETWCQETKELAAMINGLIRSIQCSTLWNHRRVSQEAAVALRQAGHGATMRTMTPHMTGLPANQPAVGRLACLHKPAS